ncbi:MAG: Gfo/Idh/MocA family oxidoreductase [Planctomycetota bacterium]
MSRTRSTGGQSVTCGLTRRDFLRDTAAAGAALTLGAAAAGGRAAAQQTASAPAAGGGRANGRLGVGFIGVGGRGRAHLEYVHWLQTDGKEPVEIAAVCDVYRPRLRAAADGYKVRPYDDYRELLADKGVDVVCVATPDHLHAPQAIAALAAGKHVYCEKPVTHWRQFDLTKQLAEAAAKSKAVFQLGTQAMSDGAWRQMKKLVGEGAIGKPLFGETGFFRTGDWGERGMPVDDPQAKAGKDLNWEAFLGDAPPREFSVDRFFRWRLFEDYAGGPATDLYPHCLTQVIDILGLKFPRTVVATGGVHRYDYELREVPDTFNMLAEYPEKVTVSVVGTQANDFQGTGARGSGARIPVIRGWDGALTIVGKEIVLYPNNDAKKPPQRFAIEQDEDMIGHWRNFLECCRRGDKGTNSPMELAYHVQTALIMASWSLRQGKVARFDAVEQRIAM